MLSRDFQLYELLTTWCVLALILVPCPHFLSLSRTAAVSSQCWGPYFCIRLNCSGFIRGLSQTRKMAEGTTSTCEWSNSQHRCQKYGALTNTLLRNTKIWGCHLGGLCKMGSVRDVWWRWVSGNAWDSLCCLCYDGNSVAVISSSGLNGKVGKWLNSVSARNLKYLCVPFAESRIDAFSLSLSHPRYGDEVQKGQSELWQPRFCLNRDLEIVCIMRQLQG